MNTSTNKSKGFISSTISPGYLSPIMLLVASAVSDYPIVNGIYVSRNFWPCDKIGMIIKGT
jgi:hypothetical protein